MITRSPLGWKTVWILFIFQRKRKIDILDFGLFAVGQLCTLLDISCGSLCFGMLCAMFVETGLDCVHGGGINPTPPTVFPPVPGNVILRNGGKIK